MLCLLLSLQGACVRRSSPAGHDRFRKTPRIRLSCYASSTIGTTYLDSRKLGTHSYKASKAEKNGIIYTCRGGHIDTPHLRKGADWTAYLADRAYQTLLKGKSEFSFQFYEPSRYYVHITYPDNWKELDEGQRSQTVQEISIGLGQYCAFTGLTWHEIVTWFGYRPVPLYPEFSSAFSWEDSYSNLMGTHIAGIALRDTQREYNEAMTAALEQEITKLGPRSKRTAREAAEGMRGKWFTGDFLFLVSMIGRNLDIGVGDGFVTPWLVRSLPECPDAEPFDYPAPNLDFLAEYGFCAKLEIEPKEAGRKKILSIAYPDSADRRKRIEPAIHFKAIMKYLEDDYEKRYGSEVPAEYKRSVAPDDG